MLIARRLQSAALHCDMRETSATSQCVFLTFYPPSRDLFHSSLLRTCLKNYTPI